MHMVEVIIASVPHRERLVAEIWYDGVHIAEISQEGRELEVQLYSGGDGMSIPLDRLLAALQEAREKLLGNPG